MITLSDAFKIALSPSSKYRVCVIFEDKEIGERFMDFEFIPGKKNDPLFWKYANYPCILVYPYQINSDELGIEYTVKVTN